MSLRDLTWEKHKVAERQDFVKLLFSGNINPQLYSIYLYNQYHNYLKLEKLADNLEILHDIQDIKRSEYILQDFQELWNENFNPEILDSVKKYLDYLDTISNDPVKIMAHVYVRHMGDLAGGQMIAKKIPGSGNYYKFKNPDELKINIRKKLDDNMAEEANICFDFATLLFQDLKKELL
jgi:heme oxygenase (biliverdin-producing, ferredoxin)